MNRRNFVDQIGKGGLLSALLSNHNNLLSSIYDTNTDKTLWQNVKSNFAIANRTDNYLHLNSGSVGTMSDSSLEALQKLIRYMNSYPPYEAHNQWKPERELVVNKLSSLLGCNAEEITIIRNTTEGINTIINGAPLHENDAILCANHDYPHSLFAIRQRCERDKLHQKQINIDLLKGDDHIVNRYMDALTPDVKLLLLTHITHRQGYILPVKKIIQKAHERNIQVAVDAAHVVGQIDHSISDIGADYYTSSLHKWLNAPHSTGLLYVRKDRIKDLAPLMACSTSVIDQITKFQYLGTRTFHQEVGLLYALEELESLTIKKKEERLKYLTKYWVSQAMGIPGFTPYSSLEEGKYAAVWSFGLKGINANKVKKILKDKYSIHTKSVGTKPVTSLRISTNIYHLESDLDRFVNALKEISKSKTH